MRYTGWDAGNSTHPRKLLGAVASVLFFSLFLVLILVLHAAAVGVVGLHEVVGVAPPSPEAALALRSSRAAPACFCLIFGETKQGTALVVNIGSKKGGAGGGGALILPTLVRDKSKKHGARVDFFCF